VLFAVTRGLIRGRRAKGPGSSLHDAAFARSRTFQLSSQLDNVGVIFVPGGFGVFQDLGDNPVIGKMLAKAHRQQGKIVGAVCSGVSALLSARAEDGSWPFAGKQMTGFPNTEMVDFGVAQGAPWLPEERLTQAGAKYIPGRKHKDVVVVRLADGCRRAP
jgi:putative intracellular protease/amidase